MNVLGAVHHLPAVDEPLQRTYARFREAGPVIPVEFPGGVRVWAVTTYDAIREVMSGDDTRFGKHSSHWADLREGRVPAGWPFLALVVGEHMLMRDGIEHRRLRDLLSQDFTSARLEALRPRVTEIVDGLISGLISEAAGGDAVDLVSSFTQLLPVAVICELFGIPAEERPQLRGWTQALFSHQNTAEQTHFALGDLVGYLNTFIERKRREPGDDLASALVRGNDDDRLSQQELLDCLFLLIVAGHETTVHLLGHSLVELLSHPDQLKLVTTGNRWTDAVEESLRLWPPVYGSLFRYALAPTELAGVSIDAGDALLLCIGGAATDPAEYGPDADQFDITRGRREHLSFGHGVHFCLGAPLARLEADVALPALFHRFPGMRMAIPFADIPYTPSFLTYGPLSVPVLLNTRNS